VTLFTRFAQARSMLIVPVLVAGIVAAGCDSGIGTGVGNPILRLETTSIELAAGDTARIVATASGGAQVTWSSSDEGIATVDTAGLVTAHAEGETEVTATSGNARGKARVRVHPRRGDESYSIAISPRTLELDPGASADLAAEVKDAKGSPVADPSLTWTSLHPNLAGVDPMGRVTGIVAGVALITASYSGAVDTAAVTVREATEPPPPPPPSGGFVGPAELPRVYLDTRYTAPQGRIVNVPAGGNLQAALDGAQRGDQIVLQAGATYTGNFVLPAKAGTEWIVIRTSGTLPAEGTRVGPADAPQMARIVSPNVSPALQTAPGASFYRLMGLEITYASSVTSAYTLVAIGTSAQSQDALAKVPTDIVFDRTYIHGHANVSFQRCLGINSARTAVVDSYLSACHGRGMDSQAIWGANGPGPFKIVNNYLEGAGENVMFGGDDAKIQGLVPSDIEFRRNHVSRPLAWRGVWTVKNIFELKNAQRVLIEGNVFENNWADAQSGFAIVLTPRNQGGDNPWAVVRDVVFRNNVLRRSASAISILGTDNLQRSEPARNIVILNNLIEEIDRSLYGGHGLGIMISDRPIGLVIRNNTSSTGHNFLQMEDAGGRKMETLIVTGNAAESGSIGGGAHGGTDALNWAVQSWTVTGNAFAGTRGTYPPDNTYLSTLSGYTGPAGVDRNALNAAIAGVTR
jgi:hypothetical protein